MSKRSTYPLKLRKRFLSWSADRKLSMYPCRHNRQTGANLMILAVIQVSSQGPMDIPNGHMWLDMMFFQFLVNIISRPTTGPGVGDQFLTSVIQPTSTNLARSIGFLRDWGVFKRDPLFRQFCLHPNMVELTIPLLERLSSNLYHYNSI